MENRELLKVISISKTFPGVKALDRVSINFRSGEVHALLGENGAGKSTLMNILSGNYQPDEGRIIWQGRDIEFNEPLEAQRLGISMIHQENSLLPHLSVTENIFLGHFHRRILGFVNFRSMETRTKELLHELGIGYINPNTIIEKLGASEKQMVEIAKAMSLNPKLIIMDEPTASLTANETKTLMRIIKSLKKKNVCIIYISHRMEEIFEISDVISILRDGRLIETSKKKDMTVERAITLMVGRELGDKMENLKNEKTTENVYTEREVVLSVKNLNKRGKLKDINFELHKGEILGFAGLVGAGRSELMEAIFGYNPADSGDIYIKGKKVDIKHPQDAIKNNIALLPEERKEKGLFLNLSVKENINITSLKSMKNRLLINKKKEYITAHNFVNRLRLKTTGLDKKIKYLSGGNQQKAILSRWLSVKPEILILDEPTHGIDVGAKAEIYKIIEDLSSEGISVLLVSSELPELLLLSHRIIVMHKGYIKAVLDRNNFLQEKIMTYATNQE